MSNRPKKRILREAFYYDLEDIRELVVSNLKKKGYIIDNLTTTRTPKLEIVVAVHKIIKE